MPLKQPLARETALRANAVAPGAWRGPQASAPRRWELPLLLAWPMAVRSVAARCHAYRGRGQRSMWLRPGPSHACTGRVIRTP